jgi:preprotein translocase subunit SecE
MAEQPGKSSKRRVRNPETFREKALKATDESAKPKRTGLLRQAGRKVLAPAVKPIGRAAGRAYNLKPVRIASKPFRLLARILIPSYFRGSVAELKQVKWPSWQESRRLTVAVLIFALVFGVSIAVLDYGLNKVFRSILLK